ncbi:hypothetical protein ACHAXS_012346 [Conticribra weissflogii]
MKHCRLFYALMFGRLCGGIATSLLFSVFESWLIGAHRERGLSGNTDAIDGDSNRGEEKWLAKSLSVEMYGSSLVAIGSGIVANVAVENGGSMRPLDGFTYHGKPLLYRGGYITAFDACIVPLVLCAAAITVLWDENYGERSSGSKNGGQFLSRNGGKYSNKTSLSKKHSSRVLEDDFEDHTGDGDGRTPIDGGLKKSETPRERSHGALWNAAVTVWNTPNILTCCIIGSLFESAMYIFIFLWTPALTSIEKELNPNPFEIDVDVDVDTDGVGLEVDPHSDENLPFGWIFSSFMVCCMLGTIAFSSLSNSGVSASKCLSGVLALSSVSFLAMAAPRSPVALVNDADLVSRKSAAYTIQYAGMVSK